MAQELSFLPSRPVQQRIQGNGGWDDGDAKFSGENPASGAVITYYQPHRHIFGKLKIEVLDASGKVLETLPASKRPGINRVIWTMRAPAPRAPSAAQVAFNASQGPRLPPGQYQVRITSGGKTFTQPLAVNPDRRATYTLADRQAQFAAAEQVSDIFGRMTDLVAQINAVRLGAEQRAEALPEHDRLRERLEKLSARADVLRKEIVATKEGGAITGEERLREWTDQLYGAINSYDGKPSDYQMQRITVLDGLLGGVQGRFRTLESSEVAAVNAQLTARKLQPIVVPQGPTTVATSGGGGDLSALTGWRFSIRPSESAVAAAQEVERD
jgi:hypothetical protein